MKRILFKLICVMAIVVCFALPAFAATDVMVISLDVGSYKWVAQSWVQYYLDPCGMQMSAHFHADSYDSTASRLTPVDSISAAGKETYYSGGVKDHGKVLKFNASYAYVDAPPTGAFVFADGSYEFKKTGLGEWTPTTHVEPCLIGPLSLSTVEDSNAATMQAKDFLFSDPATSKALEKAKVAKEDKNLKVAKVELASKASKVTGISNLQLPNSSDVWVVMFERKSSDQKTVKAEAFLGKDGKIIAASVLVLD